MLGGLSVSLRDTFFLEGASPLLRTIDTGGKENCVYPAENKCSRKPPKSESRCVSQGHTDETFQSVLSLSLKKLKHVLIKIGILDLHHYKYGIMVIKETFETEIITAITMILKHGIIKTSDKCLLQF